MFKNTKKQGDWGLGLAIAYFSREECTISIPLTDSQDYDLVVDMDGELKRIQVKTTTYMRDSGSYAVSLTVKGGNRTGTSIKAFDSTKVDYVFIVTGDEDIYLIPASVLGNSVSLGKEYDKYKK